MCKVIVVNALHSFFVCHPLSRVTLWRNIGVLCKMSLVWLLALLAAIVPFNDASDRDLLKCKHLDLGLVVDTTKSIRWKNVPYLRRSLKQLIKALEISADGTHVSLETFANDSNLLNTFKDENFHYTKAMTKLIQKGIGKLSMPTRLDRALFIADQKMFTEENGDRAGVQSVMVLFTDGKSHPRTKDFESAVNSLKEKGVRIIVVAVGKFSTIDRYKAVLRSIGGNNVIYKDDYRDLVTVTEDIKRFIFPPTPCESRDLDVAFLVDRTQSLRIESFRLLRGFLLEIVDTLDVGPNATHTAIILFAKRPTVLNTFKDIDYHSNEALYRLISNISVSLGDRTFIDRALMAANEKLFTEEGGDRPGFPNVLVLMTDGKTNENSTNFSEIIPLLKEKKVHLVAVGIGKEIGENELISIAGNKENVHLVTSIKGLPDLFSKMLNETCSVDGGFSRWGSWSECDVKCGEGRQNRKRTCSNPSPRGYGEDCVSDREEVRPCNEEPCVSGVVEGDPGLTGFKLPTLTKSNGLHRITTGGAKPE